MDTAVIAATRANPVVTTSSVPMDTTATTAPVTTSPAPRTSTSTSASAYTIPRITRTPPPVVSPAEPRQLIPRPVELDDLDAIFEFHHQAMTVRDAIEPVIFSRDNWRRWARERSREGGQMFDMLGTPYIYSDTLRDDAYEDLFTRWVRLTKHVDVDFLRSSYTFASVNKLRDMRFRFATLVATNRVEEDIRLYQAAHTFPVAPLPPTRRDSSREGSSLVSHGGGGTVALATGTTVGSRAPTAELHLSSPPGASRGPPTYSRHSDTRATSLEAGGNRGDVERPRSPRRESAGFRFDQAQEVAPVLAEIRALVERLDRLEIDFEQRFDRVDDHTSTDYRLLGELRQDVDALGNRVHDLEQTQTAQGGWLNRLWNRPPPDHELRLTRLENDGNRRIEALERQVSRLLDFQNSATQAMLRRLPAPDYRDRDRSRSPPPRQFDTL